MIIAKMYWNGQFAHYRDDFTDGNVWIVPLDDSNTEYKTIHKWIADGHTVIDNPPE
jgi:hypothetical protein